MSKYQVIFSFWRDNLFSYSFFIKASNMDEALSKGATRIMHNLGFKELDEIGIRKVSK